jgi:hypothetical protein
LIKEILDKFSILKSVEAVASILAPYQQLRNQEHALFAILANLQLDFDALAAAKKADNAAKRKATAAAKVTDTETVKKVAPRMVKTMWKIMLGLVMVSWGLMLPALLAKFREFILAVMLGK